MTSNLILVNGAGGFLGSAVVEILCSMGYGVRATDLPGTNLEPARLAEADIIEADLLDTKSLPSLFQGVSRVVNVAGLFNYSLPFETLYKANVVVTKNMCEAALEAGVKKFVHIASIAVYGKPVSSPMDEDHPKNAANNYEQSKKQGEDTVFKFVEKGLPAVTLRPAGIYGPRSSYGQAAFMGLLALVRSSGRKKIPVMKGGPLMQHVHVDDVVGAIAAVLDAEDKKVVGHAFNVGDDTPLDQGALFRAIMPHLDLGETFTYPYYTRLYWPFIRALIALPQGAFTRMNSYFDKKWDTVVKDYGLNKGILPRLDCDFLGYMNADYVLDNSRLKSIGFKLKYPDARKGIAETVKWNQEKNRLPRF
ncbi:MAG: NAD-dependent epimerase/dehydratase family protein [Desulfobacterales bacterium]|nr:NAD-dependent epimerase/dehydratase family protein [Desulfobacterales bacterium]